MESAVSDIISVLCLIQVPPFPCVVPESLSPFNRVDDVSRSMYIFLLKFKMYLFSAFSHYNCFSPYSLSPTWMKSEWQQQAPNCAHSFPLWPLQRFQKSQQNILKTAPHHVVPYPTVCFKLFLILLVSGQMSTAKVVFQDCSINFKFNAVRTYLMAWDSHTWCPMRGNGPKSPRKFKSPRTVWVDDLASTPAWRVMRKC